MLCSACVSPAEANANESLSTLQYANRAKNIQNKAVKNIDSRSAELLDLKAFNSLLRRELVKARFIQASGIAPSQIEAMVDAMLKDPAVQSYLRRLEQLALSSERTDACSVGVGAEDRALLSKLASQLSSMVIDQAAGVEADTVQRRDVSGWDEFEDFDESSLTESHKSAGTDGSATAEIKDSGPFTLQQLCQVLDIISKSLEIQSINDQTAWLRSSIEAKISRADARIQRRVALAEVLEDAISKMSSWPASAVDGSDAGMQKHVGSGRAKLEIVNREILALKETRREHQNELQKLIARSQTQVNAAQDEIAKLRDARYHAAANAETTTPMDVMIYSSELKVRSSTVAAWNCGFHSNTWCLWDTTDTFSHSRSR